MMHAHKKHVHTFYLHTICYSQRGDCVHLKYSSDVYTVIYGKKEKENWRRHNLKQKTQFH